jgi:hypothetical protein
MKKRVIQPLFLFLLAAFLMAPTMQSCKSKAAAQKAPDDEVLIQTYCSGPEYFTQTGFFRANSVGESMDQVMSKKKALNNAKTELAGSMETLLKAVTDNYASSYVANNAEDFRQRFEGLSREVINQKLTGIKTICEKQTKTKSGNYKTYIAIELSGDEILNAMKDRVSKDTKLEMDFQYDKFKKELDKEMENYKKEN